MKEKKGFTLIELLAVIVILAIIALIATPIVLDLISKARKGAAEDSVRGIIKSAQIHVTTELMNRNDVFDTNLLSDLKYDGTEPSNYNYYGYGVYANAQGKVAAALVYNNKCYVKDFDSNNIVEENDIQHCTVSEYTPWDGTSEAIVQSEEDALNNIYRIKTAANLAWVSEQTLAGNSFAGKTLLLENNLNMGGLYDAEGNDLGGQEFTPIGKKNYPFQGEFDGQGHTIYNLYINQPSSNFQGLFGVITDSTVKNLTVKNSYINGNGALGIVAGAENGYFVLDNIKSINNTINSVSGTCSGIAGQMKSANNDIDSKIVNCYSNSKVISSGKYAGGIVGRVSSYSSANIYVENNINAGEVSIIVDEVDIGGIAGRVNADSTSTGTIYIRNNTNNGTVISNYKEVGGIAGLVGNKASDESLIYISNNINNGKVQGERGWIAGITNLGVASNKTDYPAYIINDNINNGEVATIHGAHAVGGITGVTNSGAVIYNNINNGYINAYGDGTVESNSTGGIVARFSNINNANNSNSLITNNINNGNVKGQTGSAGVVGYLYRPGSVGPDIVLNVKNKGKVEAVTGYASGIIGIMQSGYVSDFVNGALNLGEVKGVNAAGLVGSMIGIKNSITFGNLTGTNNYGVIGEYASGVNIENVYYPNTYTSSYGTGFDTNNISKETIKGILGEVYWNYDLDEPRLYKVNVTIGNDGSITVTPTSEILG